MSTPRRPGIDSLTATTPLQRIGRNFERIERPPENSSYSPVAPFRRNWPPTQFIVFARLDQANRSHFVCAPCSKALKSLLQSEIDRCNRARCIPQVSLFAGARQAESEFRNRPPLGLRRSPRSVSETGFDNVCEDGGSRLLGSLQSRTCHAQVRCKESRLGRGEKPSAFRNHHGCRAGRTHPLSTRPPGRLTQWPTAFEDMFRRSVVERFEPVLLLSGGDFKR